MRHHGETAPVVPAAVRSGDWQTLSRLLPYLWQYKWRVVIALSLMVGAKLANVSVPLLLKELIDAMSFRPGDARVVLVVPVSLLLGYGCLLYTSDAADE